jgi:hypothetical protein
LPHLPGFALINQMMPWSSKLIVFIVLLTERPNLVLSTRAVMKSTTDWVVQTIETDFHTALEAGRLKEQGVGRVGFI